MIRIKKSTIDSLQFTLMQMTDNERTALSLVGATEVRFHAKQISPALNLGDPAVPKILNILATIIGFATGVVTVPITAANADTVGNYDCYIEVKFVGSTIFCKYPFEMTVWDL